MQLFLDGKAIEAQCGETLLTLVRRAGLDSLDMAQRPLAAQIGGDIYTLNVDPVHETPTGIEPRQAVRRPRARSSSYAMGMTWASGFMSGPCNMCCLWPCGSCGPRRRYR